MPKTLIHECTVVRCMLVSHGSLSLTTGEHTETARGFETRPCAAPLFGDDERARGTCSACHGGWKHPNNYRADEPAPRFEVNPERTDHGTRDDDTGRPIVRPRYAVHDGAGHWLEGGALYAAPLVPHPLVPALLRPSWDESYEVDPAFPEYAALAAALA